MPETMQAPPLPKKIPYFTCVFILNHHSISKITRKEWLQISKFLPMFGFSVWKGMLYSEKSFVGLILFRFILNRRLPRNMSNQVRILKALFAFPCINAAIPCFHVSHRKLFVFFLGFSSWSSSCHTDRGSSETEPRAYKEKREDGGSGCHRAYFCS